MLIDSNIIIYAVQPENDWLRHFIKQHTPAVSAISYVEVLGYHRLTPLERTYFSTFFTAATMLELTATVLNQAVQLRQTRKMTLGDALVASTALVYQRTLVTRNIKDFHWIPQLTLLNPFSQDTNPTPLDTEKN
ncbi:MAG: type II toxin-antitoxin system VapC family toxin [Anaerolineae bacterium]|nr:type II toxin-antitoxin system VapC family toxin [Anaerolineae bacterium]